MIAGMWHRRSSQVVIAVGLMAALLLGSSSPVVAEDLPVRPFSMWPPNYCASSWGTGRHLGGLEYGMGAATYSLKAAGSDGLCNDLSPAVAGTFAAMPRLQVYFAPSGGWVVCVGGGTHVVNAHGQWVVAWTGTVYGCGAAPHRVWATSRITYGGNNYYDVRYTGVL
jgi:hypothetical protein